MPPAVSAVSEVIRNFYDKHDQALRIMVPPGESYTSFEKVFLPFKDEVWIWIIITFAAVFITIFVLYLTPKYVQNFVFGRNVTTPSLNVWIAFCGLGQTTRNFAGFLLMSFILFSLIIRTAYQGKSFEFLQKDTRKRGVRRDDWKEFFSRFS